MRVCECVVECAQPTDQHKKREQKEKKKTQGTHLQYIECIFLVSLPKEVSSVSNGMDILPPFARYKKQPLGKHIHTHSLSLLRLTTQTCNVEFGICSTSRINKTNAQYPTWYFTVCSGAPVQRASRRCVAPSSRAKTCCALSRSLLGFLVRLEHACGVNKNCKETLHNCMWREWIC